MGDKSWKATEREVASWLSTLAHSLGEAKTVLFGRNDARVNADDREKHSDVDAISTSLCVKSGESVILQGITAEVTRRKQGLEKIYTWIKESSEGFIQIMDDEDNSILVMELHIFERLFSQFVKSGDQAKEEDIPMDQIHCKTLPKILVSKLDQSLRYGKTKSLFPITVFRKHNHRLLVAIDVKVLEAINLWKTSGNDNDWKNL